MLLRVSMRTTPLLQHFGYKLTMRGLVRAVCCHLLGAGGCCIAVFILISTFPRLTRHPPAHFGPAQPIATSSTSPSPFFRINKESRHFCQASGNRQQSGAPLTWPPGGACQLTEAWRCHAPMQEEAVLLLRALQQRLLGVFSFTILIQTISSSVSPVS